MFDAWNKKKTYLCSDFGYHSMKNKLILILRKTAKALGLFFLPIEKNALFFVMMYILGITTCFLELNNWAKDSVYHNVWLELFIDLYIICLALSMIPRKIRRWVRLFCYFIGYTITIVDVFCFVKFRSPLNPTMLLLVGETDSREAGEFLSSYLTSEVLLSGVGIVLLILLMNIILAFLPKFLNRFSLAKQLLLEDAIDITKQLRPVLGLAVIGLLIWAGIASAHNKTEMAEMFAKQTIGQVEHELTTEKHAEFYTPIYRLWFSTFSNHLASQQINQLKAARTKLSVDSCSFRSPTIVLIIGESYNKYHSQLYGYEKPTTPRQVKRERRGQLIKFSDVVAPWNLTSFVFKNLFSMHVVGQEGDWCDYPLFPEYFRKAGYQVTFITNQFLPKAKEAVFDFSGGFFLNDPEMSEALFDVRNTKTHVFDEGILSDYDTMVKEGKIPPSTDQHGNLIIFHVMGQHVNYHTRYSNKQRKWTGEDYDRPDLSKKNLDILSHYDNATLYNDSIVDQILCRFENQDAIVIYVPDHGEECFDDGFQHFGRNHSAVIDARLAHQEFDVPFWVWCSHSYAVKHPDIYGELISAKRRRMMTDALPHLLLYLAGIQSKDYHAEYNILSPDYNERRPRIIKATVDYDKVTENEKSDINKGRM